MNDMFGLTLGLIVVIIIIIVATYYILDGYTELSDNLKNMIAAFVGAVASFIAINYLISSYSKSYCENLSANIKEELAEQSKQIDELTEDKEYLLDEFTEIDEVTDRVAEKYDPEEVNTPAEEVTPLVE